MDPVWYLLRNKLRKNLKIAFVCHVTSYVLVDRYLPIYRATWRHNPEDSNTPIHSRRYEYLKSHKK